MLGVKPFTVFILLIVCVFCDHPKNGSANVRVVDFQGGQLVYTKNMNYAMLIKEKESFNFTCKGQLVKSLDWKTGKFGSKLYPYTNNQRYMVDTLAKQHGNILTETTGKFIMLPFSGGFDAQLDPTQVTCAAAENDSLTAYVNVFPFKMTSEPESKLYNASSPVKSLTFNCTIGVPEGWENASLYYELVWYKQLQADELRTSDKYKIVSNGTTFTSLTINSPGIADASRYTCAVRVRSPRSHRVKANITLQVDFKAAPNITAFKHGRNKVQGDTLKLECLVVGHPISKFFWHKDGKPLAASDRVQFSALAGVENRTIRVMNLNFSDSGVYGCTVEGPMGNATEMIDIKVKDRFAALFPFLGICVEVVLLCAIIFFFERRHKKSLEEEARQLDLPENAVGYDEAAMEPLTKDGARQRNSVKT